MKEPYVHIVVPVTFSQAEYETLLRARAMTGEGTCAAVVRRRLYGSSEKPYGHSKDHEVLTEAEYLDRKEHSDG